MKSGGGTTPIYDKNNSVNNNKEGTKKLEVSLYRAKGRTAQAQNLVRQRSEGNIDSKKNVKDPVGDNGKGKEEVSQQSARSIPRRPPPPSSPPPLKTTLPLSTDQASPQPGATTEVSPGSRSVPPPPSDLPPSPPQKNKDTDSATGDDTEKSALTAKNLQDAINNFDISRNNAKVNSKKFENGIKELISFDQFKLSTHHKKSKLMEVFLNYLDLTINEFAKSAFEENAEKTVLEKKKNEIVRAFGNACDVINKAGGPGNMVVVKDSLEKFISSKIEAVLISRQD